MKTKNMKQKNGLTRKLAGSSLAAGALIGSAAFICPAAHATTGGFDLGDAANYAVIFQGGGGNKLNINNPSGLFANTDTGNIGIAGTGALQLSGPLIINGNVDFAGSVVDNAPYTSASGTGIVNGTISGGHANVQTDMNNLNALSTLLGGEAGTHITLAAGTLDTSAAGNGMVDAMGNKVFTVDSVNAPNGNLTIKGDGTHKVVLNISAAADSNIHFNNIILTGGLTPDDVLFNLFGGNGSTLSGGPTLDLNSGADPTHANTLNADFLDPYGSISLVSTILDGRVFGGDSHDEQLVSGGTLVAPPSPPAAPDSGSTVLLLGLGCLGLVYAGSKLQIHRA